MCGATDIINMDWTMTILWSLDSGLRPLYSCELKIYSICFFFIKIYSLLNHQVEHVQGTYTFLLYISLDPYRISADLHASHAVTNEEVIEKLADINYRMLKYHSALIMNAYNTSR